jgi:hypothetical protein
MVEYILLLIIILYLEIRHSILLFLFMQSVNRPTATIPTLACGAFLNNLFVEETKESKAT